MRLLLDSHVLIWWLDDPQRLRPEARLAVGDPRNVCLFSSASVWEIGLKCSKGKLMLPRTWVAALRSDGFGELPVTVAHAEASLALPPLHGDPFDRLLLAQTRMENAVLVSRDAAMPGYGIPVLEA